MTVERRTAIVTVTILVSVLLCAAGGVWYMRWHNEVEEKNVADESLFNEAARESFTNILGSEISLDDFEGKPLLVTSWASWCPQCADELVLIDRMAGEVGQGKVQVLAINRNEPREQAQRFLATLPSLPNITLMLDKHDHFFAAVGGFAMPETIFYNPAGEIKFHKRGNLTEDDIRTGVSAILAEE